MKNTEYTSEYIFRLLWEELAASVSYAEEVLEEETEIKLVFILLGVDTSDLLTYNF